MLTGTLVTVAGFVPIGFAKSSAGEYTFSLFAVVLIALLTSWFVAVIFSPLIGVALLKAPRPRTNTGRAGRCGLSGASCAAAMRWRWATIGLTLAVFVPRVCRHAVRAAAVLPVLGPARTARRPQAAGERLDLRERRRGGQARTTLKGDPDVDRWSFYVGHGAVRFYLPLNVQLPNDFFAQAVVVAKRLSTARDG